MRLRIFLLVLTFTITYSTSAPSPQYDKLATNQYAIKIPLFPNEDGSVMTGRLPRPQFPIEPGLTISVPGRMGASSQQQARQRRKRVSLVLPDFDNQQQPQPKRYPFTHPLERQRVPKPLPGERHTNISPPPPPPLAPHYPAPPPPSSPLAPGPGSNRNPDSTGQVGGKYEQLPFPKWLTDFTGMTEWPGPDPPYIPLDFISFSAIPEIPLHDQAECHDRILRSPQSCSFDCFNCVEFDDVYTCPKLSQTFDDGPLPSTLKLLDNFGDTKTTLFTLGINIVKYPEIYLESHYRGHIMGSHTWSHKFLPALPNEKVIAQIQWSIWAMNATAGHLPKWFRPPYGGIDNRIRGILRQFGMQAVLWDFDSFDWKMLDSSKNRNEADIYADVKKFKERNGGKGLMLEHDAIERTVDVGLAIYEILNGDELTVPQCVGGLDYIKTFQ